MNFEGKIIASNYFVSLDIWRFLFFNFAFAQANGWTLPIQCIERLHQNVLDKNGTFWLTFYLFLGGLLNVTCSPLFVRCEQHLQPSVIFNLNSFYWLVLLEFPMLCITFISWPGEKSRGWQKSQGPQSFMSWSLIWNPRDTEVLWTISETKVTTKPEPSWTIVCN